MLDTTLKSLVSWLPYSSTVCGGLKMPSKDWYLKRFSRRSGMSFQLAVTAIANQNLN